MTLSQKTKIPLFMRIATIKKKKKKGGKNKELENMYWSKDVEKSELLYSWWYNGKQYNSSKT